MSDDLGDPTCWTDRENAIFNAGWNECLKFQPGENKRLRAGIINAISDMENGWDPPVMIGALRKLVHQHREKP